MFSLKNVALWKPSNGFRVINAFPLGRNWRKSFLVDLPGAKRCQQFSIGTTSSCIPKTSQKSFTASIFQGVRKNQAGKNRFRLFSVSQTDETNHDATQYQLLAPAPVATETLGVLLAQLVQAGDCICMYGGIGAGKSTLSRALIQHVVGDDELAVASPTFMLSLTYEDHAGPPIRHYDLYRLRGPEDFCNLELESSFASCVSLVEWAERLQGAAPRDRLDVHFTTLPLTSIKESSIVSHIMDTRILEQTKDADEQTCDLEMEELVDLRVNVSCIRLTPYGERWSSVIDRLFSFFREHEMDGMNGLLVYEDTKQ